MRAAFPLAMLTLLAVLVPSPATAVLGCQRDPTQCITIFPGALCHADVVVCTIEELPIVNAEVKEAVISAYQATGLCVYGNDVHDLRVGHRDETGQCEYPFSTAMVFDLLLP